MKLVSLELRNYRRHARTRIDWPDGVIAVLGRNGSGKSTLLESIGFALFGVPATRTGKDLLRWDGAGPMDHVSVALEFQLGGQAIRIHRELRGKGLTPNATLTVDGKVAVDPGAGSNDAVTQEVERRLGMDRDTFFTTLVAHQGDLDRLAEMSPAKRKQLLLEMLGIDALDRAIERARERRRELQAKVEALRDAMPDGGKLDERLQAAKQSLAEAENDHRIATASWEQAKKDLDTATAAWAIHQAAAKAHEAAVRAHEAARNDHAHHVAKRNEVAQRLEEARTARARIADLAADADRYPELQADVQAATARQVAMERRAADERFIAHGEQRLKELQGGWDSDRDLAKQQRETAQQLETLEREIAVLDATRARCDGQLDDLERLGDAADCPTCQRPLSDHLPKLHDRLVTERDTALAAMTDKLQVRDWALNERDELATLAKRAGEIDALRKELDQRRAALPDVEPVDDMEQLRKRLAASQAAHEERLRLQSLADETDRLEATHAEATAQAQRSEETFQAAAQALVNAPPPGAAHDAARTAHEQAVAVERDAERAVLAAQGRLDVARQAVEHAEGRIQDAKVMRKRLRDAEDEARYWAAVAAGRGKGLLEAFKAHLVGRIGPAIGREASRLLERFTGGRYTEITLDGEYNVYVTDNGRRYTLDRFSGGESDLVHLALRLAVSRLLVERNAAEMRFLALDEVFGSLDDERRRLVLAALQQLGTLYTQVLLVTHHDTLRDALDAALVVDDVDGEAKVTLHAG